MFFVYVKGNSPVPIHSQVDPIGRCLRTRVVGPLTMADIRQHVGAVASGGVNSYTELIDAREAGTVTLSPKEMLEVAHQARRIVGDRPLERRAFVVSDDDGFMLARAFAALVAGWVRVGVFEDPQLAESWLRGPDQ